MGLYWVPNGYFLASMRLYLIVKFQLTEQDMMYGIIDVLLKKCIPILCFFL